MYRFIEILAANWLDFVFVGVAVALWLLVNGIKHLKKLKRRNDNDNGKSAERYKDV
jgi:hypothetical protein